MASPDLTVNIKVTLDMSPEDQARLDYLIDIEKKRKEAEKPIAHMSGYLTVDGQKMAEKYFSPSSGWRVSYTFPSTTEKKDTQS